MFFNRVNGKYQFNRVNGKSQFIWLGCGDGEIHTRARRKLGHFS